MLTSCRVVLTSCRVVLCVQENILLSQRGPGNIKVVDFGSSCYEQQRGERT